MLQDGSSGEPGVSILPSKPGKATRQAGGAQPRAVPRPLLSIKAVSNFFFSKKAPNGAR